jgi:glycosyltransferase involved in cell wall biosynthesis
MLGAMPLIPALSVVMPAYNEEQILPIALEEAEEALTELCEEWEVIVVDDGSKDRTLEIIEEYHARQPRVRPLALKENHRYTQAIAKGFREARHEAIFYTDADAQFDLREIGRLYPHLEEHAMVTGYRVGRQDPAIRFVTSAVYNRLQGLLLGVRVRDVNCAFKLFRRSFFDHVEIQSAGFLIDAELYARARRAGLTWTQVGVRHRPREQGVTTVKPSTVTETLQELWRLKRSL